MEHGRYHHRHADGGDGFSAVSATEFRFIFRSLYTHRIDGCAGWLDCEEDGEDQPVWRKIGQRSRPYVLRCPASASFPACVADASGIDLVYGDGHPDGAADILRRCGNSVSLLCRPAHLAEQTDWRRCIRVLFFQLRNRFVSRTLRACGQDYRSTFLQKFICGSKSDSSTSTGNNGNFICGHAFQSSKMKASASSFPCFSVVQ